MGKHKISSQDNYQGNPGQVFAAVVVDDQVCDSDQFAQVCGVSLEWVSMHVQAGVFNVHGDEPARSTHSSATSTPCPYSRHW
jgi:hypothetical protein